MDDNVTLAAVAATLGLSPDVARRWLSAAQIRPARGGRYSRSEIDELIRLSRDGLSRKAAQ
jgi:hypothetical protein